MNLEEKTLSKETLFKGIVFDVERINVALGDGSHSKRDVVRHIGGVGILARRADGKFLLVKQYRKAVESLSLEIVAGMRESNETPEVTGKRELEEETGYSTPELIYLGKFLPSPGYTDEVDELFYAELDQAEKGLKLDSDERLVVEAFSTHEISQLIREQKIIDGKTLTAWFLAKDKGLI